MVTSPDILKVVFPKERPEMLRLGTSADCEIRNPAGHPDVADPEPIWLKCSDSNIKLTICKQQVSMAKIST
jgi:hypothetical protein